MRHLTEICAGVVLVLVAHGCGDSGSEFESVPEPDAGSGATGGSGGSAGMAGSAGSGGSTQDAAPDGSGGSAGMDAAPDVVCNDVDGDGVDTCNGDCDDNDPTSYPGNSGEICGDGADNDCASGVDDTCGGLGTFVSALTGDDMNPGTKDMPVKTIAKGVANAQAIQQTTMGSVDVFVAEGDYAEKVKLVETINLVGGFSCSAQPCGWTRDPALYVANIQNQDFEGVLADSSITRRTRLDGFKVSGLSGDTSNQGFGTVGVTLQGGTPTVINNNVVAGDSTGGFYPSGRSSALAIRGPSNDVKGALIDNNTLAGGSSVYADSSGLYFDAANKPGFNYAEVTANRISAGKGRSSTGVVMWSAGTGTLIRNNDISGGEATNGGAWGINIGGHAIIDANRVNADAQRTVKCSNNGFCGGIQSVSSTSTMTNNIVFGAESHLSAAVLLGEFETPVGAVTLNSNYLNGAGDSSSGTVSAAIVLQHGSCCGNVAVVGRIANNILDGGNASERYGVYEVKVSSKAAHPELLQNNDFYLANPTAQDAYYQYWDGVGTLTKQTTIAGVNGLSASLGLVSGNFDGDPMLDPTFHLQTGSPCVDKSAATDLPSKDFEGDPRPLGAAGDVGPDESQ